MRSIQVSELKERVDDVLDAVRNGERVELREGERVVADLVPSNICNLKYATPEEPLTSLGREQVRYAATGEIRDGAATASVSDNLPDQTALRARLDELIRQGKARRGMGTLPPDFLTRPLAKAKKSILEALLEDRHSD
jgi:antitoxin (DNA-binding transcriptional repressor) of toxin-antitoxin stability system